MFQQPKPWYYMIQWYNCIQLWLEAFHIFSSSSHAQHQQVKLAWTFSTLGGQRDSNSLGAILRGWVDFSGTAEADARTSTCSKRTCQRIKHLLASRSCDLSFSAAWETDEGDTSWHGHPDYFVQTESFSSHSRWLLRRGFGLGVSHFVSRCWGFCFSSLVPLRAPLRMRSDCRSKATAPKLLKRSNRVSQKRRPRIFCRTVFNGRQILKCCF